MRYGFTTGSCSAAAAKAAAYMLLSGNVKENICIETPKGIPFHAQILDIRRSEKQVSCAVEKDAGDDPDVTHGAWIYAEVTLLEEDACGQVYIDGGKGVGRVTKPGLDQPVGNAAINSVPRSMIQKEVAEVMRLFDCRCSLRVIISVPEGERLAGETFNPRLGILGGISILGTSGIVEPMSSKALLDTIYVELRQRVSLGHEAVAVSPGNYGLDFMRQNYQFDLEQSVKCSNFIGDTIDMAAELGIRRLLLTGHIGKLIKVSGGIMNTHSREGDCRMELLAAAALRAGASAETAFAILDSVTTEEGIRILSEEADIRKVMELVMEKVMFYLKKRAAGRLQIECMIYSNDYGLLGQSAAAGELLQEINHQSRR